MIYCGSVTLVARNCTCNISALSEIRNYKEFWSRPLEQRTEHIRHIHFKNDMNNNKMERLNGEIRDREKTMRGLKKMDTPILTGYQIYHNYIRPHMALEGKTPSDMAGIKIEGQNKWLTIIQNASKTSQ